MIRLIVTVVFAAAFRTGPSEVAAQTRPPTYEREVFTYPAFDRRDPFRPLHLDTRRGPRSETSRWPACCTTRNWGAWRC